MGNRAFETLVGAVVVVVAVAFFVFAYDKADVAEVRGYHVTAEFSSVGGLKPGADVRIAGIKVGTVTRLELDTAFYLAKVTMSIQPDVELTEDTFVSIASEGLLGGSYVQLSPGGFGDTVGNGDVLTNTQSAVDLMDLISRAMFGGVSQSTGDGAGEGGGQAQP